MTRFWQRSERQLEARLRAERPVPRPELVEAVARRVGPRPVLAGRRRFAFAGALTAVMLAALASVGGISYAASAARSAAEVVKAAVVPTGQKAAIGVYGINSGGDQYRPGFGFGDPNHNHTGPPGLTRSGGEAAPPLRTRSVPDGKARLVSFRIQIDEQSALRIHVLDPDGRPLLLTQKGTTIGGGKVTGPQTKTIRYTVRVPRSIPITLRIPANLLTPGATYKVHVVATDPSGQRSELLIPFTA
jgi:hypothetical protein